MGFEDVEIILDSENGVYYAGQTVYGRIVFSQKNVQTIHGIWVDMKGFCKVHWTTTAPRRRTNRTHQGARYRTVNHDSHEEYFRSKHYILGNENGEVHLQPGQHEFKFEFPVPGSCPSSFEGSNGHIRYRIKVVMVTSGIFSMNMDKWVPVKIHAPLDLNQNPYCKEPMEFDLSSTYCCCCISAGSSEIMVRMPVGGYCPGQVIPIEVNCRNDSNVEIDEIKLAIKKDVTYTAVSQPGQRKDHDTVAEIKKGPVPGRTTRNWTVEMEVPAIDMYNVNSCGFINIDFHFKVSTEISGCHRGTDETLPIIIGTIPLVGFQDNVQNPLIDQLPKCLEVNNVQGTNCYPLPIINQPLPNSSYPGGNPGFPTTPNLGGRVSPYPGANSPYPPGNSPYPSGNSPYPSNTPYSMDKSQGFNPNLVPPYPNVTGPTPMKTGTIGFGVPEGDNSKLPLLPAGTNVPYPTNPPSNPYATASAPEPSTPGNDEQKLPLDGPPEDTSEPPPYNPDFMKYSFKNDEKEDKKDEKETNDK